MKEKLHVLNMTIPRVKRFDLYELIIISLILMKPKQNLDMYHKSC